jgi:hypothetical protein
LPAPWFGFYDVTVAKYSFFKSIVPLHSAAVDRSPARERVMRFVGINGPSLQPERLRRLRSEAMCETEGR